MDSTASIAIFPISINAIYMDKIAAFPVCDWHHDPEGENKESCIKMVGRRVITVLSTWTYWFDGYWC
ncbi:hypothetical protein DVQ84_06245 [Yersinia enterocolitica]|nr:hypothetical protein [Yersinia enterocolitica]QBP99701.1 hypothetical protein YEY1_13530 [Yersinia enterocolitica subsp. palearctica]EKN4925504.1 hypothetical protein [Yersinia enterocolitica]EKN4929647.1 hypothetical protein [Yersinia enterocolitica]EKN5012005.1 hypothetical protein [Yersinia enterocolitica]